VTLVDNMTIDFKLARKEDFECCHHKKRIKFKVMNILMTPI
jgi:hypothetical protein